VYDFNYIYNFVSVLQVFEQFQALSWYMVLLTEPLDFLESLQIDCSPALKRLIRMYDPLKSLQTLAADSDLTLARVFQLAGRLVYWAKATIIYPLCESDVYVVSPDAILTNRLLDSFSERFPGVCLLRVYTIVIFILILRLYL